MNKKPFMPGRMTVKDLKEHLEDLPNNSYVYFAAHDVDPHMADPVSYIDIYHDDDDNDHVLLKP